MTATECIRQIETLGGGFKIVGADRIRVRLPENPPSHLVSFLHANREAIKAAILHQPDQITIEPLICRITPKDDMLGMMQEIKARIDDGLLELTGKVRFYPKSNVVEVEYRYCE